MPLRWSVQSFEPLLEEAVKRLTGQLDLGPVSPDCELLARYLTLVAKWSERLNLTAARSPEELVDLSVADAAVLATEQSRSATWVDVGSGSGAPGLVLALLRPDAKVTLVEPRAKRIAFLRTASATLGCQNVSIRRCRSEQLESHCFDIAMSRATLTPHSWLLSARKIARAAVWAFWARGAGPRCSGLRCAAPIHYRWPLTDAPRYAGRYEKTKL